MKKRVNEKQKRMAKLITAALLCSVSGAIMFEPAVASAEARLNLQTEPKEFTINASSVGMNKGDTVIGNVAYIPDDKNPAVFYRIIDPFTKISDKDIFELYQEYTGNVSDYTIKMESGELEEVIGGYSKNGKVSNNTITINGGNTSWLGVSGGISYDEGTITGNIVNAMGGEHEYIEGGYSRFGTVSDNTVNVSGGVIGDDEHGGEVEGGYSNDGATHHNTVNISGGTLIDTGVYGGSTEGNAVVSNNTVNITNGTINNFLEEIYGGWSENTCSVTNNSVNISGGTTNANVYGGSGSWVPGREEFSIEGNCVKGNSVNIDGGTVNGNLIGGYVITDYYDNPEKLPSGSVTSNNTVTIKGGNINGNVIGSIVIDDQNQSHLELKSSNNVVTINGGTFGSVGQIIAGSSSVALPKDNIVNLTGKVTGLDGAKIYGYIGNNANDRYSSYEILDDSFIIGHLGNELHIGGTKTYDSEGKAVVESGNAATIWQGKSNDGMVNNKVNTVSNFETIALHSVAWDTDLPVIEAKTMRRDGALDITDLAFYNGDSKKTVFIAGESMSLIKSGNNISGIKLIYKDVNDGTVKKENLSADGTVVASRTFTDTVDEDHLSFTGKQDDKVKLDGTTNIIYSAGAKQVADAKLTGAVDWNVGEVFYKNTEYTFAADTVFDLGGLNFNKVTKNSYGESMTLISGNVDGIVTNAPDTFDISVEKTNTVLSATASGAAAVNKGQLEYTVNGVTLNKITVDRISDKADTVPENWTLAAGATVETENMVVPILSAGTEKEIITGEANFFNGVTINGVNKYVTEKFNVGDNGIMVTGTQGKGIKTSKNNGSIVYAVGTKDVDAVNIGSVAWERDITLSDASNAEYNYEEATLNTEGFDVSYDTPEKVTSGESMTLIKANDTLKTIINEEKAKTYQIEPVPGVTIDAAVIGTLANSGNNVNFTATENKANELIFGKVEWTGDTPLLDHGTTLTNVSFDGATVDTSAIDFHKEIYIEADKTTTLVSGFDGTPGAIRGDKYLVGTAYEGEGAAEMDRGNLIFRTKTAAGVSEQTHKTVMASEVGVTMLNVGNEYVSRAMESMGDVANVAPDGTMVGAAIGGGRNRYETGSYVNINSWNAAVAVGAKRELKDGTLEYGLFGEYGKANYTLHSNAGRGDGDAHYAGGGLLAKWINKHDVYTEASFRLGRMNDSAKNLLYGPGGIGYGYNVHANYYGAHIGLGKIFKYDGGKSLDVYGKFFYTKRDGVEFDSVQHYDLDGVASSVLRVGARYGTTDKKWNWYGGLSYEYEFDGKAEGTVNWNTAIRSASVKGGSVRSEIGMRMNATKTNPWQTDISLYGYGGKHRGFGGNVNLAYMF